MGPKWQKCFLLTLKWWRHNSRWCNFWPAMQLTAYWSSACPYWLTTSRYCPVRPTQMTRFSVSLWTWRLEYCSSTKHCSREQCCGVVNLPSSIDSTILTLSPTLIACSLPSTPFSQFSKVWLVFIAFLRPIFGLSSATLEYTGYDLTVLWKMLPRCAL